MNKVILVAMVAALAMGWSGSVEADEIATTDSGKKVVLKDDGTWSVLESRDQPKEIISVDDLMLDAKRLESSGDTLRLAAHIAFLDRDTCFTQEFKGQVMIDTKNISRTTMRTIIGKCKKYFCGATITGRVSYAGFPIRFRATSIDFN